MGDPRQPRSVLLSLVPALSYGAKDGFARLSTLRDLERLVRGVADRARGEGADPGLVASLERGIAGFDGSDEVQRRAIVGELARVLATAVELPEQLAALARGSSEPSPASLPPVLPHAVPLEEAASDPPGPALAKVRVRRAARRRRAVDAPAAEAEATYAPAACWAPLAPLEGDLATPVREAAALRGKLPKALQERALSTVGQVLFFLPSAYEDRRDPVPIAHLVPGQRGLSVGTVRLCGEARAGKRRVLRVLLGDGSGNLAATWFRYAPWMRQRFKVGERYLFSGEVRLSSGTREIVHPEMEPFDGLEGDAANYGRVVPRYPGLDRTEQRALRGLALNLLDRFAGALEDPLPASLVERLGLPSFAEAVRGAHFPAVEGEGGLAALAEHRLPFQQRLAFDELFHLQLGFAARRKGLELAPGIRFRAGKDELARACAHLPFTLTGDQRRALEEIAADMARPEPMNRLLQGDVGSGKTAVAALAALVAVENGYQAAFMAPTEILAEQHYRTLAGWLAPRGHRLSLLTASSGRKEAVKGWLARGGAQVCVGTHALLQGDVSFARLGLVVIDEQHRFGVLQRAALMNKGVRPDVLAMTATPIPRTLAMALYGDLEVSRIRELPPGRTPVQTRLFGEAQREKAVALVRAALERGEQGFVVYPLVEESEKSDLASAVEGARQLAQQFPGCRIGLLHGRMKGPEKEAALASFLGGQTQLLVSTTVVEVGVDVPNATLMVVEAAERFGLSQLHQLRGRVGRGSQRSLCLLLASRARSPEAWERLQAMRDTSDGFVLAERDLALRGAGELAGTRQSGVPGLTLADLARDEALLLAARQEARRLIDEDPALERPEHARLRRALEARWEGKLHLARVG